MNRTAKLYCGFQFFFNLLLWVPIFYEFQRRIGLSDYEIFGIQSVYYLAFCIFEIPTGFIADRWGYRNSMRFGALFLLVANLFPIFILSYTGFLVHFLLIALSRSLISGAASAYLYEYLKTQNNTQEYKKIEGKARAYGLIGKVVCWAGVGYLMSWQLNLPYWLTAFNSLLALFFASLLPEIKIAEDNKTRSQSGNLFVLIGSSFATTLKALWKSSILLFLMLQGVGIFVLVRVTQVNLYQPILGAKGFAIETYGWIMSIMTICEAVGAANSHLLRRYFRDITAVFFMTIVISLSLIFVAKAGMTGVVIGLCFFSLASGVAFPIQKQVLNDNIADTGSRATILSVESIIDRAAAAIAVLPLGGLVATGQLDKILYFSSAIAIFLMSVVYLSLYRYQKSAEEI